MAKCRVTWGRGGAYTGEIMRVTKVTPQTMTEAGTFIAVQVERRSQGGRDEAGNRFTPYSAAYAKAKNVSRSAVDLTRSGDMWSAWGVLWASVNRVRIGFTSKAMERRARYNEENGRPFLGIERRWLHDVKRRIAKGIGFTRL